MKLKSIWRTLFLLSAVFCSLSLSAEVSKESMQRVTAGLGSILPGVLPDQVSATPVPGLYEVMLGPRLVYISEDGRYLLQGNIIDLQTRENITEPRLKGAKIKAVNDVGEANMLVFAPAEGTPVKHTINVFTDIDCGYCRKLHREMDQYNAAGIKVRYLFYPRAGLGSESYKKAVQVWCSDDRQAGMDTAKAGKELTAAVDCENPVEAHMTLGTLVGVSGTPALVLEDGEVVPGYVPADRLVKILDQRAAQK